MKRRYEDATPCAKKLKLVVHEASYVIAANPGGIFGYIERDATEHDAKPPTSRYTHACNR